jgi:Flp pilus assembly protein CpaB
MLMITAAIVAGGLGIALVRGYSASVSESYGRLKPALVATTSIRAGEPFTPRLAERALEVRQVPVRFAPAGVLARVSEAVGFVASVALPAGSYVSAAALRLPRKNRDRSPGIGRGRVPLEISVSGADALPGPGVRVDVLVTREAEVGRSGRTEVVVTGVPLLAVSGPDAAGAVPGLTRVVLAVPRRKAIELVDAEAFARRITILGRPDR